MNIKEAKIQIKNAMRAYFTKNEFGDYMIPMHKQRPVLLMGPPGVGKTAIIEQIASELGVGIVSYSMTHHTRQSALGLPFITKKLYNGVEYSVSEYTMSEIIASVYEVMESSGVREGILFLDEINCVSETLAPSMLQFLQYKIFGTHKLPDGWIIVAAGNPPQYNKSARELDMVTLDRVKRINVEEDYSVWKEYANSNLVHPAVLTYLENKKENFYHIENNAAGMQIVTARGWTDLSDMIKLYELDHTEVDYDLIAQYIQNSGIARDFEAYYSLWSKYRSDYQTDKILNGIISQDIVDRTVEAPFDERIILVELITSGLKEESKKICLYESTLKNCMSEFSQIKKQILKANIEAARAFKEKAKEMDAKLKSDKSKGAMIYENEYICKNSIMLMERINQYIALNGRSDSAGVFSVARTVYGDECSRLKKQVSELETRYANAFSFIAEVFGKGTEMLILVTDLTLNLYSAKFISNHNCPDYFDNVDLLDFRGVEKDIEEEIQRLEDPDESDFEDLL